MADYTNNYKYIAETWIDNGEEEGFKTAYLNALLLQWQGHSDDPEHPKFDADTVDGKHFYQIQDAIDEAVRGTIKDFYLGYTHIKSEDGSAEYKIGIDAINLYPDIANIDSGALETYGAYKDTILIPWGIVTEGNPGYLSENPTLYEFLREMYNVLQADINTKANASTVDELVEWKNDVDDIIDGLDVVDGGINAKAVNGLRFFIVTQAEYEGLTSAVRDDLHNIFIIKEQEDIDAYYESIGQSGTHTYQENPNIAPFDHGYEFQVAMAEYEGETVLCLMYKLAADSDNQWKVIAPVSAFIDKQTIKEILQQELNNGNFVLSKEGLIHSMSQLYPASENENTIEGFPITSYYNGKYVFGAYTNNYTFDPTITQDAKYGTIIETRKTKVPVEMTSNPTHKCLNFDNPIHSLYNAASSKFYLIENKLNTGLDPLITNFNSLLGRYNTLTNGSTTTTIKQLEDEIGLGNNPQNQSLIKRIEALEAERTIISNIDKWTVDDIYGLYYPKTYRDSSKKVSDWINALKSNTKTIQSQAAEDMVAEFYQSKTWYNEALGLCTVYIRFLHYYDYSTTAKKNGKEYHPNYKTWLTPTIQYTKGKNVLTISWKDYFTQLYGQNLTQQELNDFGKVKHYPLSTLVMPSLKSPSTDFIRIQKDGTINVYTTRTKNAYIVFWTQFTYKTEGTGVTFEEVADNQDDINDD